MASNNDNLRVINYAANCTEQFRRHKDAPAIVFVWQESQHEILKRYTLFKSGGFETELCRPPEGYRVPYALQSCVSTIGIHWSRIAYDPATFVISRLEEEAEVVAAFTSLAVCPCEMKNPRPLDLKRSLQKYKNLKELILENNTQAFSDPAFSMGTQSGANATMLRNKVEDKRRQSQFWWPMMVKNVELGKVLKRFVQHDSTLVLPNMMFMLRTDANAAWKHLSEASKG
ncbi:hypothetical protein IFR04_008703 [Cadophora malorum]|uniref:Uncharacterized protein n=1 Tax=Cadophora malorum TaxID=108018 RepID=A0A8H7W7H7_9HELO|nr:hypothetical protein IFR04_008703 [Cadophora malorum]